MTAFCAAVDWGTSSFRLWLLGKSGAVLQERRSNEGLLSAKGRFAEILEGHLTALNAPKTLPVIICGMAGSKNGWQEIPYLNAPCALSDIRDGAIRIAGMERDIRIVPGVSQTDPADVMRGEETQLLGAARDGVFCLPGTHSKWARIENSRVVDFSTWMTGELFALLSQHSILSETVGGDAVPDETFRATLNRTLDMPERFTNALFSLRAEALVGETRGGGASALSGILIGLELVGIGVASEVTLIASDHLSELYAAAFDEIGAVVTRVDATEVTQAGLMSAANAIWGSG